MKISSKGLLNIIVVAMSCLIQVKAQSPRQVIVEHFTNTLCSICAAKNPAFYNTIHNTYPQLLHIAYHPSAPYSQCYFNLQNVSENDARTNYYGVYGGTPRVAVQGKAAPGTATLLPASAVDSTLNQFAPFKLNIFQQEIGNDSVHVGMWVLATAAHAYTSLNLYAVVTEDTIFYAANNGETVHYDVFRQQLFPANGASFLAPSHGDSTFLETTFKIKAGWMKDRISITGMIQEPVSKYIVQSGRQTELEPKEVMTSLREMNAANALRIFPNPASTELSIQTTGFQPQTICIYNMDGRKMLEEKYTPQIDISALPSGIYLIQLKGEGQVTRKSWVKM